MVQSKHKRFYFVSSSLAKYAGFGIGWKSDSHNGYATHGDVLKGYMIHVFIWKADHQFFVRWGRW